MEKSDKHDISQAAKVNISLVVLMGWVRVTSPQVLFSHVPWS